MQNHTWLFQFNVWRKHLSKRILKLFHPTIPCTMGKTAPENTFFSFISYGCSLFLSQFVNVWSLRPRCFGVLMVIGAHLQNLLHTCLAPESQKSIPSWPVCACAVFQEHVTLQHFLVLPADLSIYLPGGTYFTFMWKHYKQMFLLYTKNEKW